MINLNLGPGIAPDVTVLDGVVFLCYGHTDGRLLFETFDGWLRRTQDTQVVRSADCSHAFPRLWRDHLVYSFDPTKEAILRDLRDGNERVLGLCAGTWPVAIRDGRVAWRSVDATHTFVMPYRGVMVDIFPTPELWSDGISRLSTDHVPIYMAEDFKSQMPLGTRPCWADDLMVLEANAVDEGVLARLDDGREMRLWRDQECFTPRCATVNAEQFVVTTWGRSGVRIAVVSRGEFEFTQPLPTLPLPVKVNIRAYSDTRIVVREPSTQMDIVVELLPTGIPHERDVHVYIETPHGKDRSGRTRRVVFG